MRGLEIISCGGSHPQHAVTNDDLARIVDTSDEWIRSRTGICSRYFCVEERGETTNSMAIAAAKQALERSGLQKEEIGCIITATVSGDYATPSVSCMIQRELGLREDIPVLDVNAACTGFMYALETARGLLEGTGGTYALVTGAEQLSKMLDMNDRSTCVLFGDGAGSCVVKAVGANATYASYLGAKGEMAIEAKGPGSSPSYIKMDGKEVFRFAVGAIPKCIRALLDKTGRTLEDVDWVVCHQANSRIIDHCVKRMKAPAEKFYENMDHFGNTSGASIPLAINEMYEKGLLQNGQDLLLVGFGSGLTWGGIAIRYQANHNNE